MKLTPNNFKFKKIQKRSKKAILHKKTKIQEIFYLISLSYGLFENFHIELIRRFITKHLKRKGSVKCKVSLTLPLTKKATQSRMGKGYGKLNKWVGFIQPGQVIFEISVNQPENYIDLKLKEFYLNQRLPFKCKFLYRRLFILKLNKIKLLYHLEIQIKLLLIYQGNSLKYFKKILITLKKNKLKINLWIYKVFKKYQYIINECK